MSKSRIIIGISGSSGIIYGIRLLQVLQDLDIETHLVITRAAQLTRAYETSISSQELKALGSVYHPITDIASPIASGSFKTMGMIIAPCSMKSLSEIAHGFGHNLLSRAADVVLKERRRLVVLPREAPLNLSHIQNMLMLTQMGGIVFPPVPAFYQNPMTIDDIVDDTVGRVLNLFDLDSGLVRPWGE